MSLVVLLGLALAFGGGILLGRELEQDSGASGEASAAPPPRAVVAEHRIEDALADAEQEIPDATQAVTQRFQTEGGVTPQTMDAFIEQVITNVDRYWAQTLVGIGLSEPTVFLHHARAG
jgi:hypothetical protein